jgi:hypothetical protein
MFRDEAGHSAMGVSVDGERTPTWASKNRTSIGSSSQSTRDRYPSAAARRRSEIERPCAAQAEPALSSRASSVRPAPHPQREPSSSLRVDPAVDGPDERRPQTEGGRDDDRVVLAAKLSGPALAPEPSSPRCRLDESIRHDASIRPLEAEPAPRQNADVRQPQGEPRWRVVDRALREIAARRAALDAEEAQWLREAEALRIWRQLGMVSALDYLERVLHYSPRTAQDRLRVARALGALPMLTAALTDGALSHSAIRELTRVVTPATEARWLAAATGKNLRQIEDLVAHHRPGDGPDDPPDPEPQTHVVRFELSAETYALLRQTRMVLDDEHGTSLSEDALITALCSSVLDGAPTVEPSGRAKFQIAMTVCAHCRKGWQEGAGAQIVVEDAVVERALCEAQHIGSIDGSAPERAHQDIPPSVVRFVWRRDGGRCRVDGCRSARGIEIHHIVHRADGGTHDPLNLALLCSSCHLAHRRGALSISGTADQLEVRRPRQPARAHAPRRAPPNANSAADAHAHAGTAGRRDLMPSAHVGTAGRRDSMPSAQAGAAGQTDSMPSAQAGAAGRRDSMPSAQAGAAGRTDSMLGAQDWAPPFRRLGAGQRALPVQSPTRVL